MKTLRILSVLVLLAGVAVWFVTGRNLGWSKTSQAVEKIDPVTEIKYPEYKNGFYPGIDFLGLTVVCAGVLYAASFIFRKKLEQSQRSIDQ